MDAHIKMMVPSIKKGLFMDTKGKLTVLSRNKGVFMAAEVEKKKRHPRKDVSVKLLSISRLLIKRSSNVNSTSNA